MSILTAYDKFIQQALKYGFSLWGTAKTGQTTKYRNGDDGDYERGYPVAPPRFVDNGDGTITDNATGLMWAKDGNAAGCNNGNTKLWADAIDWAEGLSFAGHSDWRLPNVKELRSIVDFSKKDPCIDTTYFPNTKGDYYWTSTTWNLVTTNAWNVQFIYGRSRYSDKSTGNFYVRAVRLGKGE